MEQQIYEFETTIKSIKKSEKKNYVDILVRYEIKNTDLEIDDYISVNCIANPQMITFLNDINNINDSDVKNAKKKKNLIVSILNYDIQNSQKTYFEDIINHAKSQQPNKRIQFIISFLDFIKLNIKNHVFNLSRQSKNLPDPHYIYQTDKKLEEAKAQLNKIQVFINEMKIDPSIPKVYFYFLETPVSVNQKKMIKIRISDQNTKEAQDVNYPKTFQCYMLGSLEIPNRIQLDAQNNKDFEDMLLELLPKHTIFVVTGESKILDKDDIIGGFYRLSSEFLEGFKMIAQYVATGSLT
ncbi:hypothetical protein TTHERM_00038860 (macronuclear) [Tetrahymena thermophila SB210]|uniref:Uncharacterized protein n=1 Tax=Tetrahymena thermophila (strain SB210) TaxID=312017 RepID=Q22M33_TETTS|nr:hypothetical protein TTHERM_00038860 [Tetrahymena thermophila SB210]EAR86405.1 hypothetical protein TTHERM_00038860 [Tetrahymena thermophila SB210]|eukprot:XP_977187.1 hypothetical protein TTHERM_00038860 [Tetrahymena thermophila SB210]